MGTLGRLTAEQLDLARDIFDFTQTLSDTLGDLGTPADGFDSYLADTVTLLSTVGNPGDSLLDDLNLAAGIGSSIDPLSLQSDATSLPATLAAGDSILSDASALAGSVSEPAPPGGGSGGGGGGGTGSGDSAQCGRHGQSKIGQFDYHTCNRLQTLPIVRVQDGPCTFVINTTDGPLDKVPAVSSVTVVSGDTAIWGVTHDSVTSADGKQQNPRIVFKITPARVGHFDATLKVVFTNPASTDKWCMSVDVIA